MIKAKEEPLDRRERRRLDIRRRLLDAAYALFEAKGYKATTVADICEAADVAYKTFFNHFPSKQDVLLEIEQMALDGLLEHFAYALSLDVSTGERLRRLFERIATEAQAAGPMHRDLLTELIHSVHVRGDEPEQVRRVSEAIARLVEAGRRAGDLRDDYADETITELIQGAYYVLMFSFGNLDSYPIVERARALSALVVDAITPT